MRVLESTRALQPERLVVRSAGKIQFVDTEDIDWINAEANYVRIYASGRTYLMRETVGAMEARLDPSRFVRIRSSTIAGSHASGRFGPLSNGIFELQLQDGTRVTSARRFRDRIEKIVSEAARKR